MRNPKNVERFSQQFAHQNNRIEYRA